MNRHVKVLFCKIFGSTVYLPNPTNPDAFGAWQRDSQVILGLFRVIFGLGWSHTPEDLAFASSYSERKAG